MTNHLHNNKKDVWCPGSYLLETYWLNGSVALALKLMGCRRRVANLLDKFVVIGAHHTSNWDFVIFIASEVRPAPECSRWFGSTRLRWPFGALMRLAWGGRAIRRQGNTVEQAVRAFAEHEQFILLSPEGTRKKDETLENGLLSHCPRC
jgi:1-acyl-sn-glycerol-3-phosphate acyltransferase